MTSQDNRMSAFDNLRAILALIGIPFHAAFFLLLNLLLNDVTQSTPHLFKLPNLNLLADIAIQHYYFIALVFYIHAFRMPAFFLMAGFFAHLLYSKHGVWYLVKNRFIRIGIPFLCYFLWTMLLYLLQLWALSVRQGKTFGAIFYVYYHNGAFLSYINNLYNYWFLYYLLIFYVAVLLFLLIKKYSFIPLAYTQKINSMIEKIMLTRIMYYILPIFFAAIFLKAQFWYLLLDDQLLPSLYLVLIYGIWFFIGWFLWLHEKSFLLFARFSWQKTIISFLCYVAYLFLYVRFINTHTIFMYVFIVLLYTTSMTLGVFGFFGIAFRFFSGFNYVLNYFSKASYWIYLTQLPIVFFLVQIMLSLTGSFYLQFFSAIILCLLICTVSYHFIVRKTGLRSIVG